VNEQCKNHNLTEEEYSLVLNETNCPDPFRISALNFYRDIASEKLSLLMESL
jgi:hypothetical protein